MLKLRAPNSDEDTTLTDLCLRSKASWGYDTVFMIACRAELTLTPSSLLQSGMQVAEMDGSVVGLVELKRSGDIASIEKLFVDPAAQRTGVGRQLFEWAKANAIAQDASTLIIESDPQAADFYRCMGAIDDGNLASTSIAGRHIPRLKLTLRKFA